MRRLSLTVCVFLSVLFSGPLFSATGTIAPFPKHAFFDANGDPCNGCKLFSYTAGTSTKVNTFSEVTLSSANANPIVLDSAGRATIFLTPGVSYKFVLAPSNDTDPPASPYWTVDSVSAVPPASTSADTDVTATAGATIAAGDAVYWSDGSGGLTTGRVYPMDADNTYSSNLASAVGFATAAISTGSSGTVRVNGRVTGLTGLVAGSWYYASATAGALTSTKPTNGRLLGIADSTTSLVVFGSHPDASSSVSGLVSTGAQTLAGVKTFSSAPTFSAGVTWPSTSVTGNEIFARCTSALTKNANTSFSDITGLAFAVGANETWEYTFYIYGTSSGTADWKFTLTGPAAATGLYFGLVGISGPSGTSAVSTFGSAVGAAAGNAEEMLIISGILRNGANAGTVQAQMAQQTSDATNTVVRVDSYVVARKRN